MLTADQENTLQQLMPPLGELSGDLAARLKQEAQAVEIDAGTLLFDEGGACDNFVVLTEGSIRVVKLSESGRELLLYRVGPGESCVMTVSCLLGSANYSARGIAETKLRGIVLPKPVFDSAFERLPTFRARVFEVLGKRLSNLMVLVEEVAFRKMDQRLASALLRLKPCTEGFLSITHQMLADELGTSREVISRLLESFESQGFVTLGRKRVDLQDSAALADLADEAPA